MEAGEIMHQGSVYALKLQRGKWYVGYTTKSVEERFMDHAAGNGAWWTSKYSPIAVTEIHMVGCIQNHADIERRETEKLMMIYGVENVRGGPWVQCKEFTRDQLDILVTSIGHDLHIQFEAVRAQLLKLRVASIAGEVESPPKQESDCGSATCDAAEDDTGTEGLADALPEREVDAMTEEAGNCATSSQAGRESSLNPLVALSDEEEGDASGIFSQAPASQPDAGKQEATASSTAFDVRSPESTQSDGEDETASEVFVNTPSLIRPESPEEQTHASSRSFSENFSLDDSGEEGSGVLVNSPSASTPRRESERSPQVTTEPGSEAPPSIASPQTEADRSEQVSAASTPVTEDLPSMRAFWSFGSPNTPATPSTTLSPAPVPFSPDSSATTTPASALTTPSLQASDASTFTVPRRLNFSEWTLDVAAPQSTAPASGASERVSVSTATIATTPTVSASPQLGEIVQPSQPRQAATTVGTSNPFSQTTSSQSGNVSTNVNQPRTAPLAAITSSISAAQPASSQVGNGFTSSRPDTAPPPSGIISTGSQSRAATFTESARQTSSMTLQSTSTSVRATPIQTPRAYSVCARCGGSNAEGSQSRPICLDCYRSTIRSNTFAYCVCCSTRIYSPSNSRPLCSTCYQSWNGSDGTTYVGRRRGGRW